MTTLVPLDLESLVLERSNHDTREEGVCLMEAVAWFAGEPHTDHPACVSPVLGAFGRRWNDDLDDAGRQRLKPYIPRLVGTAGDPKADEARAWMLTDWMVRVHAPAWLDLSGLKEQAAALRALSPLDSAERAHAAAAALSDARGRAAAARAAAWAAAWDAARAAAWAAAWAAARDAARAAAWAAARDAARAAAWAAARDAAWDAAWAAAWDAARAAAWAALEPTTKSLQESAFDLLNRMLSVKSAA